MGTVAFIFPGQGSQTVGMGKNLKDTFKEAREVFAEADETLGFKLSSLCFEGPETELNLTSTTQPAILTVSVAALRVLKERMGIGPNYVAGHSLGEYSALIAVKSLNLQDGVKTVQKRGQFMQEAVPEGEGGMAAVLGLKREEVEEICRNAADGEVLTTANFNCPGQIVISGHTNALQRAILLAKEKGARRTVALPVSVPFHCELMVPAGERLGKHLNGILIKPPEHPVVTNVEARENKEASRVKELLVKQMSHPLLWEDSVRVMITRGVDKFIEIGPGKVLSGLVKRISKSVKIFNVEDTKSLDRLEKAWKETN
ncbi:MAG: ACP S-malonyltransferase [Deltaproteobacteria bacterium]|nr:ACP S-malonyltransferase [Deltaproteobacteria bacterium]